MQFIFDIYDEDNNRTSTTTSIDQIDESIFEKNGRVVATDMLSHKVTVIQDVESFESFRICRERATAWKPERKEKTWNPMKEDKDHVNPTHYQGYISTEKETLQWLEAMQYLPRFRNPESFKAAVELQARKYLDRNGGKDVELQELSKGLWYFKFLVAYIKNGDKPIRVEDINKILAQNGN